MTATLAAILILLGHPEPCDLQLAAAVEHVESRGQTLAVSRTGARGLWQVQPQWSRVPAWALHVPAVGRWEGCRILRRWERRARARCAHEGRRCNVQVRALAAYNAGVAGLRGQSREGMSYARAVLARTQTRVSPRGQATMSRSVHPRVTRATRRARALRRVALSRRAARRVASLRGL